MPEQSTTSGYRYIASMTPVPRDTIAMTSLHRTNANLQYHFPKKPGVVPRCISGTLAAISMMFMATVSASPIALPELGDASETVLSRQAERKIGEQSMQELRASGGYLDDPEVNAYLNQLGHRLLAADPSIDGEFQFFAVPARDINAFALPGGFIGVNTGLILAAESESQLASVLAHEISHVTQHHMARQMAGQSGSQLTSLAAVAAAILAARLGGGEAVSGVMTTAAAAQAQSQINFTREHEQEADRIGFNLLVTAGFDPQAMAGFFTRMQQATRFMQSNTPSYLRSHPLTQQRIAEAQDRAVGTRYRQVEDSVEFHFVHALLSSYDGEPGEAVARLSAELEMSHGRNHDATRYGLAATLLRAKNYGQARKEIEALDPMAPAIP